MPDKRPRTIWIPLHSSNQNGRQITLTGTAKAKLTDKILAPRSMHVRDRQRKAIGTINRITNDSGAITLTFTLTEGAQNPGGKFILGLALRGIHVTTHLYAADPGPEESSPQAYVGMLGEEF